MIATLGTLSTIIHIVAGTATLIAGPIAIFANRRYTKLHKIAGKTFFYAMLVVCISGIIGFFKYPDKIFYQFLLGISIIVLAGILRGVRALQMMKGDTARPIDYAYTGVLAICTLWMLGMAAWGFKQGVNIAFPILFTVFALGSLSDVSKNIKMFSKPMLFSKAEWLNLHVGSMIGCFIASTTAFTVNTASFLPWYIQWFGPTFLLLPLLIYWQRKLVPNKQKNVILSQQNA